MALTIKRVRIDSLIEDAGNTRRHNDRNLATIAASLKQFGQVEPLVVQESTKKVVGGNGRLAALKAMGMTEVDIVEVSLNDAQAAALSITLNRTAELADWDTEALTKTLDAIKDQFDLDGLGWSADDISALTGGIQNEGEKADAESMIPASWQIIVECDNEQVQKGLLERFIEEGIKCRAIM